jgi:RNA-directed DNA polymerase
MDIAKVQKILATKAFHQPQHRFNDLYRYLKDTNWLEAARFAILRNAGARTPGIDRVVGKDLTDEEWQALIHQTAKEMKEGTFQPQPVRRIYIPKANGVDLRPLGIPTIRDRMVQEVLRMVLEPIYESHFLPCSFGFRPNKSTMDAINRIQLHTNNQCKQFWIVEGDIKGCFDNISHTKLIHVLRQVIADEKLLAVIWAFLKAGYVEDDALYQPNRGTPQGGICSPLLANVFLHEMDKYWWECYGKLTSYQKKRRRSNGAGNVSLARYADDFVVFTNGSKAEAIALKNEFDAMLSSIGLTLSPNKTLVTHVNDGFDFLGFHIQRRPQHLRPECQVTYVTPSERNVLRYKDKIRTILKNTQGDVVNKIWAVNRVVRGWANYYRHVQSSKTRNQLDYWTYRAVWRWLDKKHGGYLGKKARYARYMTRTPSGQKTLGYRGVYLASMSTVKFRRFIAPPNGNPYLLEKASLSITVEEPITEVVWTGTSSQNAYAIARQDLLAEKGPICQRCGEYKQPYQIHAHHIKAQKDGGRARKSNLTLLCEACHRTTRSYGRKRQEI